MSDLDRRIQEFEARRAQRMAQSQPQSAQQVPQQVAQPVSAPVQQQESGPQSDTGKIFNSWLNQEAKYLYPDDPNPRVRLSGTDLSGLAKRFTEEEIPTWTYNKGQNKADVLQSRINKFNAYKERLLESMLPPAERAKAAAASESEKLAETDTPYSDTLRMGAGAISGAVQGLGALAQTPAANPALGITAGLSAAAKLLGATESAKLLEQGAQAFGASGKFIETAGALGRQAQLDRTSPAEKAKRAELGLAMQGGNLEAAGNTLSFLASNPGYAAQLGIGEALGAAVPGGLAAKLAKPLGALSIAGRTVSAPVAAALGTEVTTAAGQAGAAASDAVSQSLPKLMENPEFQKEAQQFGGGEEGIAMALAARQRVAMMVATGVALPANAAVLGATRGIGGTAIETLLVGPAVRKSAGAVAASVPKVTAGELFSEGTQGAVDQLSQNIGEVAGGARAMGDLGQGIAPNAVLEGVLGGTAGGTLQGVRGLVDNLRAPPAETTSPEVLADSEVNAPAADAESVDVVVGQFARSKGRAYFADDAVITDSNREQAVSEVAKSLRKKRSNGNTELAHMGGALIRERQNNELPPIDNATAEEAILTSLAEKLGVDVAGLSAQVSLDEQATAADLISAEAIKVLAFPVLAKGAATNLSPEGQGSAFGSYMESSGKGGDRLQALLTAVNAIEPAPVPPTELLQTLAVAAAQQRGLEGDAAAAFVDAAVGKYRSDASATIQKSGKAVQAGPEQNRFAASLVSDQVQRLVGVATRAALDKPTAKRAQAVAQALSGGKTSRVTRAATDVATQAYGAPSTNAEKLRNEIETKTMQQLVADGVIDGVIDRAPDNKPTVAAARVVKKSGKDSKKKVASGESDSAPTVLFSRSTRKTFVRDTPLGRRLDSNGAGRLGRAIDQALGTNEAQNFVTAEPSWGAYLDTAVARLSEFFKKQVVVFDYIGNDPRFKVNGAVVKGDPAIFISALTDKPASVVFGHELLHDMQKNEPELYRELQTQLRPLYNEQAAARYFLSLDERASSEAIPTDVESEYIADIFGDVIGGEKFLAEISATNPSLMQRLLNYITKWLESLKRLTKRRLGLRNSDTALVTDIEAVSRIVSDIAMKFARANMNRDPAQMEQAIQFARKNGDPDTHAAEAASEQAKYTSLVYNVDTKKQAEVRSFWDKMKDRLLDANRFMRKAQEVVTDKNKRIIPFEKRPYEAFIAVPGLLSETNRQDDLQAVDSIVNSIAKFYQSERGSPKLAAAGIKNAADLTEAIGLYMYAAFHAGERNSVGLWKHSELTPQGEAIRDQIRAQYFDDEIDAATARSMLEDMMDEDENVRVYARNTSGMDLQRISQIKSRGRQAGLDKLAAVLRPFVRKAQQLSLEHKREAGMLPTAARKEIDLYGWTDYLPAKGFLADKGKDEDETAGRSTWVNGYGKVEPRMEGRRTEAADYLPTLISDIRSSARVMQNQKAMRVLSQFVRDNPGAIPGAEIRTVNMILPDGSVRKTLDKKEHEFASFRNGSVDLIKLPTDLSNNMKSGFSSVNEVFKYAGVYNSIKGRLLTAWNPSFWPVAYSMDFLNVGAHVLGRYPNAIGAYFANHAKQGFVAAALQYSLSIPETREKLAAKNSSSFAAWARRYEKAGGETYIQDNLGGFGVRNSSQEFANRVENMTRESDIAQMLGGGSAAKGFALATSRYGLEGIEAMSNAFEMASRIAAFKALVEVGKLSDREAGITTKQFMNFNQTGTWGRQMNSVYLFSRVALTSLDSMARLLRDGRGRNAVIIAALSVGLISYYGLTAGMSEEERRKFNNQALTKNYVFKIGDQVYQSPMAYGPMRLFGQLATSFAMVQDGSMDWGEGLGSIFSAIRENGSGLPQTGVNPADNASLYFFRTVLPTAINDLEPLVSNKDYWGRSLHAPRELTSGYAFENGRPSTPPAYQQAAQFMYQATRTIAGQDAARNMDFYPEQLQYMLTTALGGSGQIIDRTMRGMNDESLGITDRSPLGQALFGRMVNKDADWHEIRRFKDLESKLLQYEKDFKSDVYGPDSMSAKAKDGYQTLKKMRSSATRLGKLRSEAETEEKRIAAIKLQRDEYLKMIEAWNEKYPDDPV